MVIFTDVCRIHKKNTKHHKLMKFSQQVKFIIN